MPETQDLRDLVEHAPVRGPEPGETVGGVVPRAVAAPADPESVAALMARAARLGLTVVARGNGTKLDWGAPPRGCDLLLDTGALTGVEHAAGDLVVRVGAGTPVAELRELLGRAGQRLSADEAVPGSTVGGLVATGLSGPRRMQNGPVRDLVIGMSVVRDDGVTASSGGRVVKNVAGYDLGKLHTGALGTLGVITSVTFRLHPVPPALRVVRARTGDPDTAHAWLAAVRRAQTMPTAVEVDWPDNGPVTVGVLVEGTVQGVTARAEALRALLEGGAGTDVTEDVPADWSGLPGNPGDTLLEIAVPPGGVVPAARSLRAAAAAAGTGAHVKGSAGAGVLHAAVPAEASPASVRRLLADVRGSLADGSVTVRRAVPALHAEGVDLWGPVAGLALMRAVKDDFDPDHRLAPGRFAGGI